MAGVTGGGNQLSGQPEIGGDPLGTGYPPSSWPGAQSGVEGLYGATYPGAGTLNKGKGAGREERPTYKGKETNSKGKPKGEGKKPEEITKAA